MRRPVLPDIEYTSREEKPMENSKIQTNNLRETLILIFSLILVVFHLYTAGFGILPGYIQMGIHWGLIGAIIILARPSKFKGGAVLDTLLVCLILAYSFYQIYLQIRLTEKPGRYTQLDIMMAAACVLVGLYLGFRVLGKILPVICIIFILYAYFGHFATGLLSTSTFSVRRILTTLYTSGDGMFGSTLNVSARFLLLFIFFGNFMEMTGCGEFFVNLANSVAGRVRGGPAQAAIYSSMLMGMVNGSGAANVATTGTFTIPLMMKTGYKPKTAGAVEAVASSGGQIMPPVMGAAAFLMAETLGIPYTEVAIAGLIPAVLYYVTLSATVYGYARKDEIPPVDRKTIKPLRRIIKEDWYHAIPLLTIIFLIFSGYSAQRAVFWAILASFAVTLIFNRKAISLSKFFEICKRAGKGCGSLALSCMLAGIIMSMINLTDLGLKISTILQTIAGGSLFITLVLAMLCSLLLGMGLPTTAAYIVLAVLIAPAVSSLGVPNIAVHMFIMYFGALSSITPPVALSAFTAANISGAGLWETGFESIKLAAAGFIIPFIFIYSNELLMIGTAGAIAAATVTAAAGSLALGFALCGWFIKPMSLLPRVLVCVGCVCMFISGTVTDIIGIGIIVLSFAGNLMLAKQKKTA